MSYRSFTQVLGGDTNLERKCRLLFGVSLLLLIVGAFWYAEHLMRRLILKNTADTAGYHVQYNIATGHYKTYPGLEEGASIPREVNPGFQNAFGEIFRDMQPGDFDTQILTLSEEKSTKPGLEVPTWRGPGIRVVQPRESDAKIIEALRTRYESHMQSLASAEAAQASQTGATPAPDARPAVRPVFEPRFRDERYTYYQPVYWTDSCGDCHIRRTNEQGLTEWPFRVVKVVMPSKTITAEMNFFIAMLFTTAIVTVFLAMIALYVVVRYVIVKPLQHLRDISEEVRRGNTNLRADLQTNDEFQELGDSFNRMLRHLVDTQLELRETNRQLDGRLDQLAQANMHLFEMNRLKSDFLANMSHELRTPLNSIIGFADILQNVEVLDARHRRYASNIGRSGRSLLEIINDILDLAKLESGRMECRPTEFAVDALVQENCDMVRTLSEEKNIDLEVRVPEGLPLVYQDQGKVQQIVTNLLSNAIKFTPEGGRISVSAYPTHEGKLALVVADTGIGIAEEDRQVIFEKFRQGSAVLGRDNLTREYSGTGLGLSIVKELCRLLDGEITFTSEVGKGSEFSVILPWRWSKPARHEASLAQRLEDLSRPTSLMLPPPHDAQLDSPPITDGSLGESAASVPPPRDMA